MHEYQGRAALKEPHIIPCSATVKAGAPRPGCSGVEPAILRLPVPCVPVPGAHCSLQQPAQLQHWSVALWTAAVRVSYTRQGCEGKLRGTGRDEGKNTLVVKQAGRDLACDPKASQGVGVH